MDIRFLKLGLLTFWIFISTVCKLFGQCDDPSGSQDGPQGGGPSGGTGTTTQFVAPRDPNEIIGPAGYDTARFVARKDNINYTILFENDPLAATAPASIVKVTYPIDANQNRQNFRLGDFGFNKYVFTVPANSITYNQRLNVVVDSVNLFVDVIAGIDITLNQAFWIFTTVDPNTGLPPSDPLIGFLPISDSSATDTTNDGNGFVNFTIKPKVTTLTGDTMEALATIIFDQNDPIETNREVHTIDAVAPTSSLTASLVQNDSIDIFFSGIDDTGGSGVGTFDLYVAQDSTNYVTYLTGINSSSIRFRGTPGSTYHFFSLATDNVGNREDLKYLPDISIDFIGETPVMVKTFIEGFYLGNNTLAASIDPVNFPGISDTLILQLARSVQPYDILQTDTALLQTDGTVQFHFNQSAAGSSYYLVIRHRNALETWSAMPLQLQQNSNSYDFTVAATQAYGNNMVDLGDGNFAIWSGDISDAILGVGHQDGVVESQDYSDMENAVAVTLIGYSKEDITGDNVVESTDYSIEENNVYYVIYSMRP